MNHTGLWVIDEDATSARSFDLHKTGIAALRDCGVRVSSGERVVHAFIQATNSLNFKKILILIKRNA